MKIYVPMQWNNEVKRYEAENEENAWGMAVLEQGGRRVLSGLQGNINYMKKSGYEIKEL